MILKTSGILLIALLITILSCSDDAPKKGITKYYITRIILPGNWEDRFNYTNDTLLTHTDAYNDGTLIKTDKYKWVSDNTLTSTTYGYPKFTEIVSQRTFTFANGIIKKIKYIAPGFGGVTYDYDFFLNPNKQLDYYEYSSSLDSYNNSIIKTILEKAVVKWQTDGFEASMYTRESNGPNLPFKVISEEQNGSSVWSGLSSEAMATLLFQEMHILEYFVPNRIVNIDYASYGLYRYDDFKYDNNSNISSFRRLDTQTGKSEYYRFEWKEVII